MQLQSFIEHTNQCILYRQQCHSSDDMTWKFYEKIVKLLEECQLRATLDSFYDILKVILYFCCVVFEALMGRIR